MSKTKKYVSNKRLKGELNYHNFTGIITIKLHLMIMEMCTRIATKPNFCNYTYIQDMISDSYMKCIDVINRNKFDVERENAFGYFTTVIHNSFLHILWREKRERKIKLDLKDAIFAEMPIRYPNIDSRFLTEEGIPKE